MGTQLQALLTRERLAKLAGERSFARGAGYFEAGAVADLVHTGLPCPAREGEGGDDLAGVRVHLESESKEALVEQAASDPDLRARMEAALRRRSPQGIQIAHARAKDHPADAAALAGKIKALVQRAGEGNEFAGWLDALRAKHKAKRNFVQRIEGV